MKSSKKYTQKVNQPEGEGKIEFQKLSVSGGIVNAAEAVKMAIEMTK